MSSRQGSLSFEHAFGMEVFAYFAENEAIGSRFDRLMERLLRQFLLVSLMLTIFLHSRHSLILVAEMEPGIGYPSGQPALTRHHL